MTFFFLNVPKFTFYVIIQQMYCSVYEENIKRYSVVSKMIGKIVNPSLRDLEIHISYDRW